MPTQGYRRWTADEWLKSIYIERSDQVLRIALWSDPNGVKLFLKGSSRKSLKTYKRQLDGIFAWSKSVIRADPSSFDGATGRVLTEFSESVIPVRLQVARQLHSIFG